MNSIDDEFHANKNERLKSFENTVKNIFGEKWNKFGDCFEKAKNPESITTVWKLCTVNFFGVFKMADTFY